MSFTSLGCGSDISIGGIVIGGTPGSVLFIDSAGALGQDNANFFWDDTNDFLGIGTNTPAAEVHIHDSTGVLKFTNATTGLTATDGFDLGIDASGNGEIRQRENLPLTFYTNNASAMRINNEQKVVVGDVGEVASFFPSLSQKFIVNNNDTTLASSIADIIKLLSVTAYDITPSGNTNSGGFPLVIYGGQGFTSTMKGSNSFNGGLPVGGFVALGDPISVLGAFGQVNVATTAGSSDGAIGLLCVANHQSQGGALDLLVGGDFSATTDTGTTGSVVTMMGGHFAAVLGGVTSTNAMSGVFEEPTVFDGGAGTPSNATNRTAMYCRGTMSIVVAAVTTAASMTNIAVESSHIRFDTTNATPAVHGFHADTFSKHIWVIVPTGVTATLNNQSATDGTAANRIITKTGLATAYVGPNVFELIYDTVVSRWVEV